ncbi:MAG: hypothetical protein KGZ85_08635 [Ignavibacterium sp.]|nr:hypothetical protein [Ignavibacterium sp.]
MKTISQILSLAEKNYITFHKLNLDEVIKDFHLIYEADTGISDKIRILKKDEGYFIQETTNKNEILFRRMKSLTEAEELVKHRLEIYEKMWDGCGCKVDYYL